MNPSHNSNSPVEPPAVTTALGEDKTEADIDRDLEWSFPASDPPGWTMGIEKSYTARSVLPPTSDDERANLAEHGSG